MNLVYLSENGGVLTTPALLAKSERDGVELTGDELREPVCDEGLQPGRRRALVLACDGRPLAPQKAAAHGLKVRALGAVPPEWPGPVLGRTCVHVVSGPRSCSVRPAKLVNLVHLSENGGV